VQPQGYDSHVWKTVGLSVEDSNSPNDNMSLSFNAYDGLVRHKVTQNLLEPFIIGITGS